MAALAGWTLRWQREQLVETRAQRVHEIGTLLVQSLETMLAQNDVSPARRLVADAARADGMMFCRVVLPDGKTPRGLFTVVLRKLPEGWRIVHDHSSSE